MSSSEGTAKLQLFRHQRGSVTCHGTSSYNKKQHVREQQSSFILLVQQDLAFSSADYGLFATLGFTIPHLGLLDAREDTVRQGLLWVRIRVAVGAESSAQKPGASWPPL